MRQRLMKNFIILNLLLSVVILSSCIDEPIIDPVKRPFSVIRVGNLSTNELITQNIKITIDGKQPIAGLSNVAITSFTNYFDVNSGKSRFLVTSVSTGDTVYNKDIEIGSYEILTLIFSGYYHQAKDTNNFGFVSLSEGLTYLTNAPKVGKASVNFINAATGTPALEAIKLSILTKLKQADETVYTNINYIPSFEYNKMSSIIDTVTVPGNYLFDIKTDKGIPITVYPSDSTFNVVSGKNYYIFFYGIPNDIKILSKEQDPLPARSK